MQIEINKPFNLGFSLVETDSNLPSIKMEVKIGVVQFTQRLEFVGSWWFEFPVWKTFVDKLDGVGSSYSELVDMNGNFSLKVDSCSDNSDIELKITKVDMRGVSVAVACRAPLDEESFFHIKHRFLEFDPKW